MTIDQVITGFIGKQILIQLQEFGTIEKVKWWILHNPANPIVKYLMWRRAYKLAKELQEELESRNK